jgi:nickel-dependent lactate racemase
MSLSLRYGSDSTLEIDLAAGALVAAFQTPRGDVLSDPKGATAAALAKPLDFPPLRQAVVPGDRVVLALAGDVPRGPAIVTAVIADVIEVGVAPGDICILCAATNSSSAHDLRLALPADYRDQIEILAHDPVHRDRLSYLAANPDGEAIYVNRRLFDADVVLPIGCVRLAATPGYFGVNSTLYPTFSDNSTLERFAASAIESDSDEITRRRHEANEVAWLLGVLLTIQVVPAAAGGVLHVVAGNPESIERRGGELCRLAWEFDVPRRAELVVAAIEGGDEQQTWENFGRALAAASRAVADDGAIALCTELTSPPGPALQWIGRAPDLSDAMRQIRKQHSPDTAAAHELAAALQRGRIYLLSRLDEAVVEELGMAPVATAADIGRLAKRHASCILLGNAQYAQPAPVEETAEQLR